MGREEEKIVKRPLEERMAKRILVVDDEPEIRFALSVFLKSKGYQVDLAEDGRMALHKLSTGKYDVMLLDMIMPNLDGHAVLRSMPSEVAERMPVVVLTAKSQSTDVMKGYSQGATYYVTKPFQNARVHAIIRYLTGDMSPAERRELEKLL